MSDTAYYQAMVESGQIKPHQVNALAKAHEGKPLAALAGDYQPILDRLERGESATEIASSLGINRVSLYAWLLRHCPEQWQAIATARQIDRLDDCEDTLDKPVVTVTVVDPDTGKSQEVADVRLDNAIVTRARDKARIAQWHLERANRKLFGQDKQLSIAINNIQSIERVIIAEPQAGISGVIVGAEAVQDDTSQNT